MAIEYGKRRIDEASRWLKGALATPVDYAFNYLMRTHPIYGEFPLDSLYYIHNSTHHRPFTFQFQGEDKQGEFRIRYHTKGLYSAEKPGISVPSVLLKRGKYPLIFLPPDYDVLLIARSPEPKKHFYEDPFEKVERDEYAWWHPEISEKPRIITPASKMLTLAFWSDDKEYAHNYLGTETLTEVDYWIKG